MSDIYLRLFCFTLISVLQFLYCLVDILPFFLWSKKVFFWVVHIKVLISTTLASSFNHDSTADHYYFMKVEVSICFIDITDFMDTLVL